MARQRVRVYGPQIWQRIDVQTNPIAWRVVLQDASGVSGTGTGPDFVTAVEEAMKDVLKQNDALGNTEEPF